MIKCDNLQIGYTTENILIRNVNFSLSNDTKKIIFIVGENGSGKTTLLKTLSTLLQPISGVVLVDCLDSISYLNAETLQLFPHLKGREIVNFFENLNEAKINSQFYNNELFIQVLDIRYSQMSSGMKQLLKLAITLTENKKIIFWDEPFKSLSERNRLIVSKLIESLSLNHLFVITSHDYVLWNMEHVNFYKINNNLLERVDVR